MYKTVKHLHTSNIFSKRISRLYTLNTKLPASKRHPKFASFQSYPCILGPFRFLRIGNFRTISLKLSQYHIKNTDIHYIYNLVWINQIGLVVLSCILSGYILLCIYCVLGNLHTQYAVCLAFRGPPSAQF